MSNGFYNLVELNRAANGQVTGCTKMDLPVSMSRLEGFKLRVLSCNFKYLYDAEREQFFLRKTSPIYQGAILICDLIMNKMIFLEVDGDNCRLKVTYMQNHGTSFQKINYRQLSTFPYYNNYRNEHLTLSNLLASNLAHVVADRHKPQIIVSRTTKNMFRCDESVFYQGEDGKSLQQLEDSQFKVKSLSLINSNFIENADIRDKNERMKSTSLSYFKILKSSEW